MMMLAERLRSWAQNEEMINQYFTDHGKDCIDAAKRIEELEDKLRHSDRKEIEACYRRIEELERQHHVKDEQFTTMQEAYQDRIKELKEVQNMDPELREAVYMAGYCDGFYHAPSSDSAVDYKNWVEDGCHEPSDNA